MIDIALLATGWAVLVTMPFLHLTPRRLRTPVGLMSLLAPAAAVALPVPQAIAVPVMGTALGSMTWRNEFVGRATLLVAGAAGVVAASLIHIAPVSGLTAYSLSALLASAASSGVMLGACTVLDREAARRLWKSIFGLHLLVSPTAALVAFAYTVDRLVTVWTVIAVYITWTTLGKLRKAEEESMFRARRDGLTGLLNHGAFWDTLEESLRNSSRVAVILLDLDNFKKLNDTFGHRYGDQALVATAKLLQNTVPEGCTVARYGGEEFGIILPGFSLETAANLAWQIVQAARDNLPTTLSVGVACGSGNASDLVASADAALYRAKNGGKDRVEVSGQTGEVSS